MVFFMSATRSVRRWILTRNLMMAKRKKQKERSTKLSLPKVSLLKAISRDRFNLRGKGRFKGNPRGKDNSKGRFNLRGKAEARDGMGEETEDVEGISKEDVTVVGISPHIISHIRGVRGSKRSSK